MIAASQSFRRSASNLLKAAVASVTRFCAEWLSMVLGLERGDVERHVGQLQPVTKWWLVGSAVLLAAVIGLAVLGVVSIYDAKSYVGQAPKNDLAVAPQIGAASAILERPIFRRSRAAVAADDFRPAASNAAAIEAVAQFNLKGVFLNEGIRKAFLSTTGNPAGAWYRLNEEVDGFKLVEVNPASVALEMAGQRQTISLRVDGRLR